MGENDKVSHADRKGSRELRGELRHNLGTQTVRGKGVVPDKKE